MNADPIEKCFVASFLSFLRKQMRPENVGNDTLESLEVGIQCLQAAYEIEEEDIYDPLLSTYETLEPSETGQGSNTGGAAGGAAATAGQAAGGEPGIIPKRVDLFKLFESVYVTDHLNIGEIAEASKNQGNRLMEEGKYNEALLKYNRAITLSPKNPIYYCNRAAAHIRLGDNERAITDCKSALIYNPAYGKAYGRLGIAYANLCNYEAADAAYLKAIQLEPNNQDYRNNYEMAKNSRQQAANSVQSLSLRLAAIVRDPELNRLLQPIVRMYEQGRIPEVLENTMQTFMNRLVTADPQSDQFEIRPGFRQNVERFVETLHQLDAEALNPRGNNNQNDDQQQPPST